MRTFTQKWAFLLMVVLFGCCLQVNAQSDLTVADGTSTSSYLPLYGLNADTQGMKGQCLYPADSLTDMAGGSISQITFYCGSTVPAEVWGGTFIVYLGETDESNLSSAFISTDDLTAVYTGTLDATSGTLTIEFDDAYTYQGGNLVVDVTLSVTGNWKSANFLGVNNLTGSGRYRTSGSGAGTATAFLPKAEFVYTPGGSVGPTCDKPESVEANDVTANSATINWIGSASAYNLQYKASSDQDWTLVKNLSGNSYELSNLVSNKAYQAQVQAICGENTSGWKSVSFNTLIGLPFAEHFDGTTKPDGWTIWSGQLQSDGSATRSSSSVWSFGSNNGVFDNHARSNIYGTGCYRWLQIPAIPIPEMEEGDQGFQMYFNLALTKYSGTLVEVVKGSQSDDRFVVLVSIDEGANWTILREWNNSGSEYVYDDIATAGEEVDPIDLSAYAGQTILLAFYGESTVSGGDNNIHVDDVIVEEIPTCLKPTGLHALDAQATSTTLPVAWTANSGETAWRLQYKPTADAEAEWITLDIAANPYTITGLNAFAEYEIRVAAVCSEEDFTDYGKSIKAKTAAIVPFFQSFDTTAMPGEWKRYEVLLENVQESGAELVATQNGWKVGAQNGVFNNEHLYLNIKDSTDYWLVSPVIEMQAGYQLTFDLALTTTNGAAVTAGEQNDDKFIVFISTDGGADWTALGTWDNGGAGTSFDQISTEGQTIKFELNDYAGQSIMLAFYGESTESNGNNNLHISNVAIDLIPACERPLSITFGTITGTTAQVTWDADGDGQWEYGYKANPAASFEPVDADYTYSTSEKIADLIELSETTEYAFFVRRVCGETEKSEPLIKTFKTIQTPAELPYSQNFEQGNGWLLINGTYPNKWTWGSAIAKGGNNSLYISNDDGESASYTGTANAVYAAKTFFFNEAGVYSFTYDWIANGQTTYDYLRVALAPLSADPQAAASAMTGLSSSTLPEGWIALDGGEKLNGVTEWQNAHLEINVENVGYYKVVLAWVNNAYTNNLPGAAVDNFRISLVTCPRPTGLTISEVGFENASFSWDDVTDGTSWVYAVALATEEEPADEAFAPVAENSIQLEELAYNTAYVFYLRKDCGSEFSETVSVPFKTLNPFEKTICDGSATNVYVPVYGSWTDNYSRSQFVYPADSLSALQWDSITSLTFHASTTTAAWANCIFEVYMTEIPSATLSDTLDWANMTKVMNAAHLEIASNKMEITLDQPYQYQGGNLLIGIKQTVYGSYVASTWYGISAAGASYSGYISKSTGSASVSQRNFLPKITLGFKPGEAPACATPSALHAVDSLITTNSAALTWTPQSAETNWVIRYKESGAEEWADSIYTAQDTLLLENLDPATIYEVQVATQCDPEDATNIGAFSASANFITECAAVATVNEDFEGSLLCWSAIRDANGYPVILTNYPEDAYSGTKYLYFASQTGYDPQDEYIVLPELISLENMRLKFYARNDIASPDENATLVVGVMPAPDDSANFVALDTIYLTDNVYTQYVVPFDTYAGDNKYVAIKMLAATTGSVSAGVEDVVVEAIPQCMEPNALTVDTLTDNYVVLTWTPQGTEANWLVHYRKLGAAEWSEPILATNDTLLISGLEMGTAYEAQVAAWCDPTSEEAKSPYGGIISFTTLCGQITALPWHMDFENMAVNSIPTCWDNSASTSSTLNSNPERIFGVYAYNDNKMLRMYNYFVNSGTALINTPAIALPASPAYEVSFDYAHTATCGDMTLKVSTDGGANFNALVPTYGKTSTGTDKDNPGEFTEVIVDLSAYAGDTIMIQFFSSANFGSGAIFVDNIDVHRVPSCIKPSGLATSDITASSVKASWDNAEGAAWRYAVALAEAEVPAVDAFIAVEDTFVVAGELTENSDYVFYLLKDCGEEDGLSTIISTPFHTANACQTPDGLAAADITVSSASISWNTYGQTGFNLRYINGTDTTLVNNVETPYVITGLDNSTAYKVQVQAACAGADEWSALLSFKTVRGIPFEEKFNATTIPTDWKQYSGLLSDVLGGATLSSGSSWYFGAGSNGNFFDNHARVNIYGTSAKYWLATPAVFIEGDVQLTFDVALTKYSGTAVAVDPAQQQDDKFAVVISTDNGTTWTVLRQWDNAGSAYVYNNIATTGEQVAISLASYSGNQIMVAFYGESTVTGNGDNNLHIDNVTIDLVPTCLKPKALAISDVKAHTAKIEWTVGGEETAWQIAIDTIAAFKPDTLSSLIDVTATDTPYVFNGLAAAHTYYVYVRANCGEQDGVSRWSDKASFTTTIACPAIKNLAVANITASSAVINWEAGQDEAAWQMAYDLKVSNEPDTLATLTALDANTYAFADLLTDTTYHVYVRANCGEEDGISTWSHISFKTAKACQTPTDLVAAPAMTSATISWNAYGQSGFNLRYSTDGENWTVINDVESPYVLSGLAAFTAYKVQVQAACAGADEWSALLSFKTVRGIPFFETFDATTIPADWSQAQGLLSDILAGGEFTTGSLWYFGTSNSVFDSHARINIYGTSRKNWLFTPAIFITENNQLTFDLALTKYSGDAQAVDSTQQLDDKFAVVISTDGGATWSVLREWNNSGSDYVYNNIATTGEEIAIDLTAYAGQAIIIGLYGESTLTGGDNNLHVDNVRIDVIPTCDKPQALTVSDVFARNATLAWESDASAWEIALDTLAGFNPDTLQSIITADTNPFTLENLLPNHTYYVYVRANCGNDGVSYWTNKQSFKTTIACPAPAGLEAQLTPGNGSIATLTWEAASAQAWQVEYSLNSDMSDSIAIFVTEPVVNLTGLTAEATYYARVKADCGELDGQSVYSAIISFVPTNIYSIVVNDGTQTNNYVPVYGMYVDNGTTASQFIVPAESLQEIMWDSITTLTFYASQATSNWGASEFEVYMTTTEDATLSELVDWNHLTQVMVAGNLSIVDNKMVVTLSEPFQYTGDNLLIGFKQTAASGGSSFYSTSSWYGVTANGASIGGYGTGNNMTQRNFLPKMKVDYVPGQAPSCMWATHLEVSEITAVGATFAWDSIEGANWEYAVVLAESNEAPTQFAPATNPIVLDNLEETTAYLFYVRNNCDVENSKLVSVAFTTTENVQSIPYATQFADASGWKMANSENAWVINNNQLYISNDGQAYAYNEDATSVSFATKLFDFDATTVYTVSYEWMCEGEWNDEDGALDFLRVALVPAAVELTAGVQPEGLTGELLPAGWIALDGDSALTRHATWQAVAAEVTVPVGQYRLAFIWINDESGADGDPAAIRNLSIAKGTITGIQAGAGFGSKAVKFIKNNQVYILVNGNIYDAIGRKIK